MQSTHWQHAMVWTHCLLIRPLVLDFLHFLISLRVSLVQRHATIYSIIIPAPLQTPHRRDLRTSVVLRYRSRVIFVIQLCSTVVSFDSMGSTARWCSQAGCRAAKLLQNHLRIRLHVFGTVMSLLVAFLLIGNRCSDLSRYCLGVSPVPKVLQSSQWRPLSKHMHPLVNVISTQ